MQALKTILPAILFAPLLAAEPPSYSGIYPHLAMFNREGECGTGAVVPWADRLWVLTYGPHKPLGSSDKLYEISSDLVQTIRPESIGGTPANRMIHRESGQLFIGPYAIDSSGKVRTISYETMFGRHTGLARHLTDPAGKIVLATMEEGIYEIDVKTLAITNPWADEQVKSGRHADLPGYHGKGFYSAQGRYVYANNGDHAPAARSNPSVPSGVLAEWDGKADHWTVVRRNQFTDVTGPGGIEGSKPEDPLWSIGWDHRSLILMLLDGGKWSSFRLPKASHCYDGAHGWNTEWPRIRDIGEDSLLMTMHGSFWKFPRTFSAANTAGIVPRSTYLKVVGDFTRWGDRLVLGCDDTAANEFLNKEPLKGKLGAPGQSQSNLWFIPPARLDECGPALGRGAVWLGDNVKAGSSSEPYLFSGYAHRSLHLTHHSKESIKFTLEVDVQGDGQWKKLREIVVAANSDAWTEFTAAETGTWIRLTPEHDAEQVTAFFQYRSGDMRTNNPAPLFDGLASAPPLKNSGSLQTTGDGAQSLLFLTDGAGAYELDSRLQLRPADNDSKVTAAARKSSAIPSPIITLDAASALYVDPKGKRWRIPKGQSAPDASSHFPSRNCREVCTERNLLNVAGTFYELPAENAGGFNKLRPVSTHNRAFSDYTSYRGLLIISGIAENASDPSIIRSSDGKCALWAGTVDDLWKLGKPRGTGGPWNHTAVRKDQPSDPYLATGYDRKRLTLNHDAATPVNFRLEADFTGTGKWSEFKRLVVPAGQPLEYQFPDAFGAYWLRLVPDQDTTATAIFTYD
jgi:hypothetical protein